MLIICRVPSANVCLDRQPPALKTRFADFQDLEGKSAILFPFPFDYRSDCSKAAQILHLPCLGIGKQGRKSLQNGQWNKTLVFPPRC